MILTTTNEIQNQPIAEYLAVVIGGASSWVCRQAVKGFKVNLDIPSVTTKAVSDLHERASLTLIEQARQLKADAVVGVRFELSHDSSSDVATVCVYGTAVKFGQSVSPAKPT